MFIYKIPDFTNKIYMGGEIKIIESTVMENKKEVL